MEETWKTIDGYNGRYEISNMGRLKSYAKSPSGTIIKCCHDGKGYVYAKLYYAPFKHKMFKIHRLVATYFLPNPNNYPQINHKDENKDNNCVDNLEWCENNYNHSYGTRDERAGMSNRCCPTTSKKIYSIDDYNNKHYYDSIGEAERTIGASHSNIIRALKNGTKANGYNWYYCNE